MSTDEHHSIRQVLREELKAALDAREAKHATVRQYFAKELIQHVLLPAIACLKRIFGVME